MVAKVMSEYSIGDWERISTMPIRVFWALFRQISILNAERSLRELRVTQLAQSGDKDALKEFIRSQEQLIETALIPNRKLEAKRGRDLLRQIARA